MILSKRLWLIYFCGFLLTVHYASIIYLNSSLLKQIVDDRVLSILYIVGSIGSILTLLLAPSLFRIIGNRNTFLIFTAVEIFAVFGIGSSAVALMILFFFLLHQAAESILYFCLDVVLEEETKIESTTGGKRGIFFTVQNIAWVFSPLVLTLFISSTSNNFSNVYFFSGLALIIMFAITALFFKNNRFAERRSSDIIFIFNFLKKGGDKTRIIISQLILNLFYAWMVIYLPLLLNQEIGFGWDKIGIILSIMLIPFLLFELPAGIMADKKYGEKEILALGFAVMSIFTFMIPIIKTQNFLIWAAILFATRIGASLVEIASETYFFKHVKAIDTGVISVFRMVRPLSFIIVPIATIPLILNFSYSGSFAFLAVLPILGLFFLPRRDTK